MASSSTCNTTTEADWLTVRSEDRELLGNTYNSAGQLVETRTPHRTVELEYDACGRVIAEIFKMVLR